MPLGYDDLIGIALSFVQLHYLIMNMIWINNTEVLYYNARLNLVIMAMEKRQT